MENQLRNAVAYLQANLYAKITTVTREFVVPKYKLRNRLNGTPPRKGIPITNTKLSRPKEKAIYKYIDRLNGTNLTIRVEFITTVTNTILRERSPRGSTTLIVD
jgi:hypothetical protein